MKKLLLAGILATLAVAPSKAHGFFSLRVPGLSIDIGRPVPVRIAPAPVCAPPRVIIAPPAIIVRPRPLRAPVRIVLPPPPVVIHRSHHRVVVHPICP